MVYRLQMRLRKPVSTGLTCVVLACLSTCANAFDDPPSIGEFVIGSFSDAVRHAGDYRAQVQELNAEMKKARKRFFDTYPDHFGHEKAEEKFSRLLFEKDVYFLIMEMSGLTARQSAQGRLLDILSSGSYDGGIPMSARNEWLAWRAAVQRSMGDKPLIYVSPASFPSHLDAATEEYKTYKAARDAAEFARFGITPESIARAKQREEEDRARRAEERRLREIELKKFEAERERKERKLAKAQAARDKKKREQEAQQTALVASLRSGCESKAGADERVLCINQVMSKHPKHFSYEDKMEFAKKAQRIQLDRASEERSRKAQEHTERYYKDPRRLARKRERDASGERLRGYCRDWVKQQNQTHSYKMDGLQINEADMDCRNAARRRKSLCEKEHPPTVAEGDIPYGSDQHADAVFSCMTATPASKYRNWFPE